jgi:formylglycine-generating enzyme required for sulfatase activity
MEAYANSEWKGRPDILGLTVAKGGAWYQEELAPIPARCASRYPLDPTKSDKATGFRCVRDVTETAGAGAPLPAPAH